MPLEETRLPAIRHTCLVAAILLLVTTVAARADSRPSLSAEDMDRRLAFISQRLNAGRTPARLWQYGWSGFFAANAAVQGYLALRASNADNQAAYGVRAVKAGAGLAQMLLRPLPAVRGDDPIQALPDGTLAFKAARLQAAEDLLRQNAARAAERTSWPRHMAAVAVNLVGGGTIAALGDVQDAVFTNMTGIAISEAHIWSQPGHAIDDLEAYERQFPALATADPPDWEINPIPGGLSIAIHF
jgi:hypothetical protein